MNIIEFGDCRETMRRWAADGMRVQTCVTSPPYFGLRDYGHEGQIGLEQTPDQYIAAMVEVFRCVRDVLADDGTLWVNIGDSYGKGKQLLGVPWRLAFALQADGWVLRQDIIWHKPNPMPESVRDRCTKAHEYVFLLSKSERYFFDSEAMKEKATGGDKGDRSKQRHKYVESVTERVANGDHRERTKLGLANISHSETRNRRSVWTVATRPYNGKKALTDYVGDDGKPYTASPDCPIHGHLSRKRTAGTLGYGGQQGQSRTGNVGTDSRHAASPAYAEQSKTFHNSEASAECSSQQRMPESSHESKTDSRLTAHISGAGKQPCSGCNSACGAHPDCGAGCSRQCSFSTANSHSTGESKTGRDPATNQPCMPCAETDNHTQSKSNQHGLFEQGHGTCESSILTGETSVHLSQDIHSCNVGKSSELASMAYVVEKKCTCNEVIIDHFATFPPALIEPCILAGTSERGHCPECGARWVRDMEVVQESSWVARKAAGHASNRGGSVKIQTDHGATHDFDNRAGGFGSPKVMRQRGWCPTCTCGHDPVPDIVLDPFIGSGTTAAVALQHGRQYLGCELNPEYGALQDERIGPYQEGPLFTQFACEEVECA